VPENSLRALTDAHCHPFDLVRAFPQAEHARRQLNVLAAASACDMEEFTCNENLSLKAAAEKAAPLLPCFAIHPQQLSAWKTNQKQECEKLLAILDELAAAGRIAAVGECGFDLYNAEFRETEAWQEKVFASHLEIALRYDLPIVLHVRRALHKISLFIKELAKCKAVVFHSWPSPPEEGFSLLRRGVNAYFSFGNSILNGNKKAASSCALLPAERILTETDAPFQPVQGEGFSQWENLPRIIKATAALRSKDAGEIESQIEKNFREVFII